MWGGGGSGVAGAVWSGRGGDIAKWWELAGMSAKTGDAGVSGVSPSFLQTSPQTWLLKKALMPLGPHTQTPQNAPAPCKRRCPGTLRAGGRPGGCSGPCEANSAGQPPPQQPHLQQTKYWAPCARK